MLVFSHNYRYKDPLNIVFLCGSHYDKKNNRDKRKILKEYIDNSVLNSQAIILEENFQFKTTNKEYLSYDDIYLTGLAQIEQLASLYANKIIIIHETISTAAELGMFAIDPIVAQKICLLIPDNVSIEEEKLSGFIRLAFFKKGASETKVHVIRYYPDVEIYRISPNKSDYHSFFHDDKVGMFLGRELDAFFADEKTQKTIRFQKNRFQTSNASSNIIDYTVSSKKNTIAVSTHIESLKIHLLSMLRIDSVRKGLREEKEICQHVNFLYNTYKNILRNTIENLTGTSITDYKVHVSLKDTNCNLKQAIGYFLYMLQATNLISLVQKKSSSPTIRKIQFSTTFDDYGALVDRAIIDIDTTAFGRLVT